GAGAATLCRCQAICLESPLHDTSSARPVQLCAPTPLSSGGQGRVRYHPPQDYWTQPVGFDAATKFNQFFYKLAERVADAPERPSFLSGGRFAKHPSEASTNELLGDHPV